ncbi:hypothetical protein IE53DRAFT_371751 [Violaceomyces palustris]|uniref:Uncharacterized protein n=1 Tax=Violaceomyces palustris TaxID=1673888 RepID=A0ACD0NMP0_9BASI|nr:hypothetical protein IE53DRAFT_371751 [Violaceomyces palustris]
METNRSRFGKGLNNPRYIFYGWTALVFVAGLGYFTVKKQNTQKKRDFFLSRGGAGEEAGAGVPTNGSSVV